ncbi:FHA domain-containing protein [Cryptosporangium sp. NPDC051539]|uniref:FHA domain-containing protein n=1 Tax=Cryptosporangium sp. NPDC051539 TaxID=3363962 RepID=UPI0037921CFE
MSVWYLFEPDEVFTFAHEGDRITFGRDDDCDLIIFSAINGESLSRVAGRIWRYEGELWVRNLSEKHELWITQPGLPPLPPLPPRDPARPDPGPAQSIPGDLAYIQGPDGCALVVAQQRVEPALPTVLDDRPTTSMPPVPHELRPVAAALCEPLLRGKQLPASYEEVQRRLVNRSRKQIRDLVKRLCSRYLTEIPELRERVEARLRLEERELGLPATPSFVHKGVWYFGAAADPEDDVEIRRRRALALPDYYEVAHLLVRRRQITADDLHLLTPRAGLPG